MRKAAGVFVFVLVAAVIGGGGGMLARWAYVSLMHSETFAIRRIEIMGNNHVDRGEILRLSGLKEGRNIFTVDLDRAARRVQSHPWIWGVTVKRNFPDSVVIHVVEREATAIIRQGGFRLIDASGEIFKPLELGDPVDMPVIGGPDGTDADMGSQETDRILRVIDLARVSSMMPESNISEIVVAPGGVKLIGIDEPRLVNLGDKNFEKRWLTLEVALAEANRSGAEVVSVDLRYKDGASLKFKAAPKTLVADGGVLKENEAH